MSILNVNQIQPVGGGNTITVSASDVNFSGNISIGSSFVGTASTATLATTAILANTATVATNAQGLTGTPDITVNNIQSGVVTATTFIGDGSGITGVTASGSGINIKDNGSTVGVAATIDFGTNLNVSPASAGIVTVTVGDTDFAIADKIVHTGDTNTAIRFPADDIVTVETAGAERLRITSAGSVGIGTNNPGTKLDVRGGNWANGDIVVGQPGNAGRIKFRRAADGSDSGSIGFSAADNNSVLSMNVASGDGTLTFQTNSAERLRITSAGNIGIGTDNPVGNLEVRDSKANLIVAKDGLTVKSNSDLHTTYDMLQIGAGGALASYSTATATADTQLLHNAYRHSGGTQKYRYADTATRIMMNSPGGSFRFESAASGSADADITFSEKLRITSDGKIILKPGADSGTIVQLNGADTTSEILEAGITSGHVQLTATHASGGSNTCGFIFRTRGSSGGTNEKLRIQSGGGISFNGDTATANALDDYEEGTFTPTVPGLSLATAVGHYVKVGSLVTCIFYFDISTKSYINGGGGGDALRVTLPFNSSNTTDGYAGASIGNVRYIDFTGNSALQFAMNIGGTTNSLYGRWIKNNSNFAVITLGDLYNSFSVHASVTYRAA